MELVVLLSGGMDSVTGLYHACETDEVVAALSFDYGAKHHARELPLAAWHAEQKGIPHRVINLDFMDRLFDSALLQSGGRIPDGHYRQANMKQTVVPFRNGIMLSIAAGFAESSGADGILITAHAGDHHIYPDCRAEFMGSMGDAIRTGTYAHIELVAPFVDMTKSQIARRGVELGIDYARTWSCYKGAELHCGTCGTCVERREAFLLAGVPDPSPYQAQPPLPRAPSP